MEGEEEKGVQVQNKVLLHILFVSYKISVHGCFMFPSFQCGCYLGLILDYFQDLQAHGAFALRVWEEKGLIYHWLRRYLGRETYGFQEQVTASEIRRYFEGES